MNLPYVDHLGILVEDLETSLDLYQKQFGFQLDEIRLMPEVGIKIGYLKAKNIAVELIQYLKPEGDGKTTNFARKTMGNGMGYNHIAIRTDDVDHETEIRKEEGLLPLDGFPTQGLHGKVCFFSKETTDGVLMEICEEPKDQQ